MLKVQNQRKEVQEKRRRRRRRKNRWGAGGGGFCLQACPHWLKASEAGFYENWLSLVWSCLKTQVSKEHEEEPEDHKPHNQSEPPKKRISYSQLLKEGRRFNIDLVSKVRTEGTAATTPLWPRAPPTAYREPWWFSPMFIVIIIFSYLLLSSSCFLVALWLICSSSQMSVAMQNSKTLPEYWPIAKER